MAVCKPQVVFRGNYLLSFGMFTTKNMLVASPMSASSHTTIRDPPNGFL